MKKTAAAGAPVAPSAQSTENEDYAVIAAQEDLVVQVQASILRMMREKGINQTELSSRLDVSQARTSQMLGDAAPNLTLRSIAKIYHVLGSRCRMVESNDHPLPELPQREIRAKPQRQGTRGTFHRQPTTVSINAARLFELRPNHRDDAPVTICL